MYIVVISALYTHIVVISALYTFMVVISALYTFMVVISALYRIYKVNKNYSTKPYNAGPKCVLYVI